MTASVEHRSNAAEMAGESSAAPFEEAYVDGITHVLCRGVTHLARAKLRNESEMKVLLNGMLRNNSKVVAMYSGQGQWSDF